MNFYSTFASAADRFGDRVAVEMLGDDGPVEVRYQELAEMAARAAGWLAARGIQRGDRVAILAGNSADWCAVYLGIMRLGAVGVPFDTNYTAGQVATLLADSGARLIFASEAFEETAREAASTAGASFARIDDPEMLAHAPETRDCPAEASDPAVILYTSGTTSDPKGVVLSHGNLLAEREAAFGTVSVSEHDSVLSVLPLFHSLPQMANLLLPFSVGARVVFLETVNTTNLTRALKERGITLFVVVPQFFYLVHQRIEHELNALPGLARRAVRMLAALNLTLRRTVGLNIGHVVFRKIHNSVGPQLRVLITGGARFDPATNRALHALGFTIQQAYGLTESSAAAAITRAGQMDFTSVGRPLPGVEIKIATRDSEADSDSPADGEVLIRGPIVMQGYYNRPDQTAAAIKDGWLHTGDLGFIDSHGRVHITGRSKDVIVLANGKNIYPEEIEAHYERCPFIAELCVAGVNDRLHALIRPDTDAMRAKGLVNIRELLRFEIEGLSVALPSHKRILGYDITVDPLPRTTTRKLKRNAVERMLREKAAATGLPADSPGTGAFDAGDTLAARVLKEMRGAIRADADLRPGAHLELDIGLDSMNRVELLVHLTETFHIEISDEEARDIVTVGDLVEAVRSRVSTLPEEREATVPWAQLLQPQADPNPFVAEFDKPKRVLTASMFAAIKFVYAIAWLTTGLRARGRDHLPAKGPYLICPNHQSFADIVLLSSTLPWRTFRELFFVGAAEYYETRLGAWMARTLNVVPIDADSNLVSAMQMGAEGLRRGRVLVLFPEGARSIDGTPQAFRKGAAILSHHLQAPMVPAAIDGAFTIWPRNQALNWRALLPWRGTRARIAFGPPVQAANGDYASQTEMLRKTVVGMWDDVHTERAPD